MNGPNTPGFNTLSLHAGAAPTHAAHATHASAGFAFKDADQAAALYNLERSGHVDAHLSHPAGAALEQRIAALEGGVAGIATASGQAALHLAISTLAGAGAHLVAAHTLPADAWRLLAHALPRYGIGATFVDGRDADAWAAAIRPETRLLVGATLGDTGLDVLDIATVAAIAHDHHLPLLVDASLTTPWLLRPFEHGADLLFHAATGFLGGHGAAAGGLLVDAGRFDWPAAHLRSGRYAELCAGSDGAHGMVYTELSDVAAFTLRARREGLRDFGAGLGPHAAAAILQGLDTLGLRMARHVANARTVAEFLLGHGAVAHVAYPELDGHRDRALAARLLPHGAGGMLSFTLKGERAAAHRCVDALQLVARQANVGEARSLLIHPASTTHARLPPAQLAACGIGPGTLRLSVGLEDAGDLIGDLQRALALSQKGA